MIPPNESICKKPRSKGGCAEERKKSCPRFLWRKARRSFCARDNRFWNAYPGLIARASNVSALNSASRGPHSDKVDDMVKIQLEVKANTEELF